MNIKFYINYETKERECGICRQILPFSSFTVNEYSRPRTYCKKCRASANGQAVKGKKADLWPHLYYSCDNEVCNNIWSKSRGKICPRCKEIK